MKTLADVTLPVSPQAEKSVQDPSESAGPLVTILLRKNRGWPLKDPDKPIGAHDLLPRPPTLAEALATHYPDDHHFVAYAPRLVDIPESDTDDGTAWPAAAVRLTTGVLEPANVQALDVPSVTIGLLVIDVDDPVMHGTGEPARPEWREAERAKRASLPPGWVHYESKGGYRLIWRLDSIELTSPADADSWKAFYLGALAWLKAHADIEGDQKCKDWTRLMRLPNVVRDGKPARSAIEGALGEPWPLDRVIESAKPRTAKERATKAKPAGGDPDVVEPLIEELADAIEEVWNEGTPSKQAHNGFRFPFLGWLAGKGWSRDERAALIETLAASLGAAPALLAQYLYDNGRIEPTDGPGDDVREAFGDSFDAVDRVVNKHPDAKPKVDPAMAKRAEEKAAKREALALAEAVKQAPANDAAKAESADLDVRWAGTFTEWDLETDPPPVPWVVPALEFGPGRACMTVGFGGDGKTVISQQKAFDIALGRKVFGRFDVRQGCKVKHIDYEAGGAYGGIVLENYARLCRGHNIDRRALKEVLKVGRGEVMLTEEKAYDWLCYMTEGFDYCLIDALVAACVAKENDADEIKKPIYMLEGVSAVTGCTFELIHHEKKPDNGKPAEARYAIRGSTAIHGALSAAMTVRPVEGERDLREVSCAKKPRYGFETFGVRFVDVPDPSAGKGSKYTGLRPAGEASWGLRIEHAALEGGGAVEATEETAGDRRHREAVGRWADKIEAVLRGRNGAWSHAPMPITKVKTAASLSGSQFGEALDVCKGRGSVTQDRNGNTVTLELVPAHARPLPVAAEARAKATP